MVVEMITMIETMVKIAAMPVKPAPHAHSRAHAHSGASSEGMSATKATTVAATAGGSCD
jgi:hypothetical protein